VQEKTDATPGLAAIEPSANGNGSGGASDLPRAGSTANHVSVPNDEPPVDIDRLNEFTDGNLESLRELVTLYLDQTTTQLEQLEAAIRAHSANEVRRLAHSCAGASATCGMRRLVPMLRELEHKGSENRLDGSAAICENATREFERIRSFLEAHLASCAANANIPVGKISG
jgi:HPt (histidine-containing phosphotransfer) domain-containing protein